MKFRSIVIVALATLAGAASLRAQQRIPEPQGLVALAISDLTFGTVLPGVPSSVGVFQADHAALFELRGIKDLPVRIELALPPALLNIHGAILPLAFGPGDGFADFSRGRPPRGVAFDPRAPVIGALGPNGRLWVRLGGTVTPGRPQDAGSYSATILMTVYDLSI